MLAERGVTLEAKPFSIGFRIEHPQSLSDEARFGPQAGHPLLGADDYTLVHNCRGKHTGNGRPVYSFGMFPGGTHGAAASAPESLGPTDNDQNLPTSKKGRGKGVEIW